MLLEVFPLGRVLENPGMDKNVSQYFDNCHLCRVAYKEILSFGIIPSRIAPKSLRDKPRFDKKLKELKVAKIGLGWSLRVPEQPNILFKVSGQNRNFASTATSWISTNKVKSCLPYSS